MGVGLGRRPYWPGVWRREPLMRGGGVAREGAPGRRNHGSVMRGAGAAAAHKIAIRDGIGSGDWVSGRDGRTVRHVDGSRRARTWREGGTRDRCHEGGAATAGGAVRPQEESARTAPHIY